MIRTTLAGFAIKPALRSTRDRCLSRRSRDSRYNLQMRKGASMWDEIPPNLIPARYLETLVARLQKEADRVDVKLPADVALYIARNARLNSRAMERALTRLVAYSSLAGTEISLAYTQKVLKNFIDEEEREVALVSLPDLTSRPFGTKKPKSDSIVRLRRTRVPFSVCWKDGMGEKPTGCDTN
jgi:hypothetical protein